MTTVTKEMAEWCVHRGEVCYRSKEDDQSFGMLVAVDAGTILARLTALEAENAALREQVKALKGGV